MLEMAEGSGRYQVGSGSMVGLPGQSVESLADDILLCRELEIDMVGIGPFIPPCQICGRGNTGRRLSR